MKDILIGYGATAVVFAAVDFVWLAFISRKLYRPALDAVLRDGVALGPAVAFYLIYIAGVMALAVAPAARAGDWTKALINGAILGAVAYATYDLTNQATLKVWATRITVADILWGLFLTATAAMAGYYAMRWSMKA